MKTKLHFRYLPPVIAVLLASSLSLAAEESEQTTCDVCVVGGGSGGFGAALAAARGGAKVILVEKQATLGGTSTSAFVTNWEPGPGCSFARELYGHLKAKGDTVAIAPRVHRYQSNEPYGLSYGTPKSDLAYDDTLRRAGAHWHWLQRYPHFKGYELKDIAPMLGIRESYRTVTEYVLTQRDLVAGLAGQKHTDIIAIADHPMDTHGAGGGLRNVRAAYGIPYRCLIPKGYDNLLVACRGAGFSHIAASSCRLSRTMIALGHAAGAAAAEAARDGKNVRKIDIARLVSAMGAGKKPTKGK